MGLLAFGSQANPKDGVLQTGNAVVKQLVQVNQQEEEKGLSTQFRKYIKAPSDIFGPDSLPPFPSGMSRVSPEGGRSYVINANRDEGYPEEYVSTSPYALLADAKPKIFLPDIRLELYAQ